MSFMCCIVFSAEVWPWTGLGEGAYALPQIHEHDELDV